MVKQRCIPCEVGDTGPNCTTRCLYPAYGQGCQSVCKCTKKDCNYVYGCKNATGNVCIGTEGVECCQGHKWNNEETSCNPCDKGYNGHKCNAICPFPTYGLDCQTICNCTETFCDPVDGCTYKTEFETYMTTNFTTAIHWNDYRNASTDGRQSMLMIGIGVLAAVALLLIFVILYTYRLENVNNETESRIFYSVK